MDLRLVEADFGNSEQQQQREQQVGAGENGVQELPSDAEERGKIKPGRRGGLILGILFVAAAVALSVVLLVQQSASSASPSSPPATPPPTPFVPPTPEAGGAGQKCVDRNSCLLIVDRFLQGQPRQGYFEDSSIGLLQTFGPGSIGGGDCDTCKLAEPCPFQEVNGRCKFDVYDNALAVIYLTRRGKLAEAKRILDAFIQLLYKPDMSIWPLAAAYTDVLARAGQTEGPGVADGSIDTGNNAWVVLAFAHYATAAAENGAGASCYADVARSLLAELTSPENTCQDALGGYKARSGRNYRSTEHQIDLFGAAQVLGAQQVAQAASGFVQQMFNESKQDYQGNTYVAGL